MTPPSDRSENLREFIDEFFKRKQKLLADEYGLSPSQVSTWLHPKSEKSEVPVYMEKIIDLKREVKTLRSEIEAVRVGRVLGMKSGYSVVHFPDDTAPGAILCRGIPDLETATRIMNALQADEAAHTSKES